MVLLAGETPVAWRAARVSVPWRGGRLWLWWGCAARLSLTRWCLLRASTCDSARTSAPRILCSDVSSLARRTCAANPRATMDTLVSLVLDEDNVVRREAVANLIRRRM